MDLGHAYEPIDPKMLAEDLEVALHEIGIITVRRPEVERGPWPTAQTPAAVTEGELDPANRLAVKEHSRFSGGSRVRRGRRRIAWASAQGAR